MKIINNGECYIQERDVEYILNNDELTQDIYSKLITSKSFNLDKSEYIKLEDQELINYIMSHRDIPDFEDLYSMNIKTLKKKMSNLLGELLDEDYSEETVYTSKSEKLKKQRYIEYIEEQIKEMIEFKENKAKIIYPSVPLPNGKSISNATEVAVESMKDAEVLVYSLSQTSEVPNDIEFFKIAYSILNDLNSISIDDLDIEKINSKYISLRQSNTYEKEFQRVLK